MSFMKRLDGIMPMAKTFEPIVDEANALMLRVNDMMRSGCVDIVEWRDACRRMREAGDGYMRFGHQWKKVADYLEPTLDDMIAAGKEDIWDD